RAKRFALDAELSKALASQPLVPGGADQLARLLRSDFAVEAHGESYAVRSNDFRNVSDYVNAQLARPEYAHFIRASNPGGGTGGSSGASLAAPTAPANPAAPAPAPAAPANPPRPRRAQNLRRGDHPPDGRAAKGQAGRAEARPDGADGHQ